MSFSSVCWSHVGLNCRDQAVTENFYREWFGFRRARVVEADGAKVIFLRLGAAYLELFPVGQLPAAGADADGPRQPGMIRHLAFQVPDLDAFLANAGSAVQVSLGPLTFDEFIPGWKTVWITDPDGVIVEVSQGYDDQDPAELRQSPPDLP